MAQRGGGLTFDRASAASALRAEGLDLATAADPVNIGGNRWEVFVVSRMTFVPVGVRVLVAGAKGWTLEKAKPAQPRDVDQDPLAGGGDIGPLFGGRA